MMHLNAQCTVNFNFSRYVVNSRKLKTTSPGSSMLMPWMKKLEHTLRDTGPNF